MSIVGQTRKFVMKRILTHFPKKQHQMVSFGIKALSFTAYDSLASNARLVVGNTYTAASKMYRLMSHKTLVNNFSKLVALSGFVQRSSVVNVDFSTFCGFQALCFGVQTGAGRAIPIWNNSITYPIEFVGSQNQFVLEELKRFGKCLGFYPRFVFDRGFWIPIVMKFMLKHKIMFYLRIKQGQSLQWNKPGKAQKAKIIGRCTKDATITLFGNQMRLIVSPPPPKQTNSKKEQNSQRWYIITNDMESSREDSLGIYATRFEIEEVFKDYKHIQKLKLLRIKKKETFTILLWFATLAFWVAWWTNGTREESETTVHPKKKRSFFRIFWEELQLALRADGMQRLMAKPG
jgi:hypothetical protein